MAQKAVASDDAVLTYIARVLDATTTLCLAENQKPSPNASENQSGQDMIRQIAQNLLQACSVELLSTSLPLSLVELEEAKESAKDKGPPLMKPEEEKPRIPDWKMTRSDYVRCLLRSLPPIALDVVAEICSLVTSQVTAEGTPSIPVKTAAASFVLFSKWLPIAPQIAPLVSDLFALDVVPCPLEYGSSNDMHHLLVVQAAHAVYEYYAKRGDHSTMNEWWSWGYLFTVLAKKHDDDDDVVMEDATNNDCLFDSSEAMTWHATRAIGFLLDLRPAAFAAYLDRLCVRQERVQWMPHPWMVDHEEERAQFRALRGIVSLFDWKKDEFPTVSSLQVRNVVPLHSLLVHVGEGIVLVKHDAVSRLVARDDAVMQVDRPKRRNLILTPTTSENLALLGAAMCSNPYPLPILVCGPPGAGKSSLVRELARCCCAADDDLLELHVDEETDSKTLIGSYTTTDIPGEFKWRPGALTQAVRSGKWVVMEDVDAVPMEIQAAIVQLLEDRMLPLGGGKFERCHPTFRLFGTCTTNPGSESAIEGARPLRLTGKKLLNPSLWRKVHVQPLAVSEMKQVGESLFPLLPSVVMDAALNVFRVLDKSRRSRVSSDTPSDSTDEGVEAKSIPYVLDTGRNASIRDFLKLLSRISNTVAFEHTVEYATEAQRTICLAETVDVFAASCPSLVQKRAFITQVAAPHWGITGELALQYMEARQPAITHGSNYTEIGRAKIPHATNGRSVDVATERFAPTNFALRLMESIGVCISENEPTLLVGETGCGKTTLLQQLARHAGRELLVQNLSLQTDSTDLLGGYRPLEIPHIARKVYLEFVDIFVATFSRKQNADFLKFASSMLEKKQWKKLAQCFTRAASLGLAKLKDRTHNDTSVPDINSWKDFADTAQQFERQRLACDSGLAFAFTEGALVDAIRSGKWVLLDEINLASSETLQRLCGLLDDSTASVTLTERGDSHALKRHPDFRLFAAMNPATDAGKKDLPQSIRARFSELYVDELLDPVELRIVAAQYLRGVVSSHDTPLEQTETVCRTVEIYLQCRALAEEQLVDASGHKPRYTMRTMCRALSATCNLVVEQKLALGRSILEGFELAFEGALDASSTKAVHKVLRSRLGKKYSRSEMDHPSRRPSGGRDDQYVLVQPFWLKAGPFDPVDWSEEVAPGRSKFILTESMSHNLRRLSRAVAAGPWPVLLEGPTSAGKTTLVEYLAARCGHAVVRINNHEHTDIQEYTGGYSSDSNGSLSFHDGLLVRALRKGHWVILDELNLAPSEVLEALNRLLDDNRELYLPEIDEVVKPHPNFRLFATQNPSGAYGGRKPLSRAFRNRFVELHMGDIPSEEMKVILEKRCSTPPSHAKALVKVMVALRQRRNAHGVFLGKDGLITPRDLLRWAERGGSSKLALAHEGYMLLAERLRNEDEKEIIKEEIESHLNVTIDCDELYYGADSEARALLERDANLTSHSSVAPTKSLLRLLTLVVRCTRQQEPVLLVGETGCGKTTVVQLLSEIFDRNLHTINCHATTETSDLLGGLRPVRGREKIALEILSKLKEFVSLYPNAESFDSPPFVELRALTEEQRDNHSDISDQSFSRIVSLVETLYDRLSDTIVSTKSVCDGSVGNESKKRKLTNGEPLGISHDSENHHDKTFRLKELAEGIKLLGRRISSLFEWVDGPLVEAMRTGQLLLLDEMSLAEDAVLERLNSVLEPSRTLVLAEKSTETMEEVGGNVVVGHDDFRLLATMNPGGDFGKRELSPALRSRFTEIWVPQVTDPSDIELVLDHTLARISVRCDRVVLRQKILNYVCFFNGSICGDRLSPCTDLVLSLRDVLSWARFVVDVSNSNEDMDVWALYCHGACLMHLDGLGLGTGLSPEDASTTKSKAISFLLREIPVKARSSSEALFRADFRQGLVGGERFGIHPFTIANGEHPVPDSLFDFDAPTPSLNLLRLLRAMQISKPILLEGSPGVGKTSLATALAAASGHRLVRINLSEQTDISDLMGSDLPNPEQGGDSGSPFRWCDGVLLRAIKQGDWVLLDELNLASQSVLEGLNSVLDHRASVFIPELGKTFHCPPSFRIFAAQNPLAQGGGRKGLPKSFLNRFTKVYVESLTQDDLQTIVCSRFPSVTALLARSMVLFNKSIHEEVVHRHEYGSSGSPWEFNLRDVFRWCELVVASSDASEERLARFARHLYLGRFRTVEDRRRLDCSYRRYFGVSLLEVPSPELCVDNVKVTVGCVALDRRLLDVNTSSGQLPGEGSIIARSLLDPLEAVASCVTMKWPCLLVGASGSGKSSLLSSLAELCNAPLVSVSLTPATDVNELVGSFEQVDSDEDYEEAVRCLRLLNSAASIYLTSSREECMLQRKVWYLHRTLQGASSKDLVAVGSEIVSLLATAFEENQYFRQHALTVLDDTKVVLERLQATAQGKMERDTRHFRWVDGILVNAMTRGYWLHLENVNLCPSSVLDRLNSVMEQNGELLLTECGVREGGATETSLQIVKQHPDFRIFLSMNPDHGEISRAMRNRCVELSLLPHSTAFGQESTSTAQTNGVLDCHDMLYSTGIRPLHLADSMVSGHERELDHASNHGFEPPSAKHVREWGQLVRGLDTRGLNSQSSLVMACRLSYQSAKDQTTPLRSIQQQLSDSPSDDCTSLMAVPSVRWGWSFCPDQARLDLELRLVKVCGGDSYGEIPTCLQALHIVSKSLVVARPEIGEQSAPEFTPKRMQKELLSLYIGKSSLSNLSARSRTLDGYDCSSSGYLRFMVSLLDKVSKVSQCPTWRRRSRQSDGPPLRDDSLFVLHLQRLTQLCEEQDTHGRIAASDCQVQIHPLTSPLETSVYLSEGRIDRSFVSCPATPMLYPFFCAVDEWIYHLMAAVASEERSHQCVEVFQSFLAQRDQLWTCLRQCIYNGALASNFLGFDERGFIVQWIWLKKRMNALLSVSSTSIQDPLVNQLKQRVEILVEALDRILFGADDGLSQSADALWKKGGHPLVPRKSTQWEAMALLNQTLRGCTLLPQNTSEASFPGTIELQDLVESGSPVLFLESEQKGELLAALCMCFWTSTDEVRGNDQVRSSLENQQLCTSLCDELGRNKRAFDRKVRASKVDINITTVENVMDVESLSKLRERDGQYANGGNEEDVLRSLLHRFAQIQVFPLHEYWYVREEAALIETLAEALVFKSNPHLLFNRVRELAPRLRVFIDVALMFTCVAVDDLRPYQTLVWFVGESCTTTESVRHLLRCLLPRMMNTLSQHKWFNSFNSLDVISDKLEMPSLWIRDETKSLGANDTSKTDDILAKLRQGPLGLQQSVKSQVMFRLVGSTVSSVLNVSSGSSYATIENHVARKKQAQSILSMFSTLELPSDERHDLHQVLYLFVSAVESLIDFFPGESGTRVLAILRDTEALRSADVGALHNLFVMCNHSIVLECLEPIVFPLLSSLRSVLNGVTPDENVALCWIYVGLLRMNLLVPRSPLDPGTKPATKVVEYDRYLDALAAKIAAIRLDSICVQGVPPNDQVYHGLMSELTRINDKRAKQERKGVERSCSSPSFIDFFRECQQFFRAAVAPEGIPALVRAITEVSIDEGGVQSLRTREQNWQATSGSFCSRVLVHFAVYEDVAIPFVNAIENAREGIRLLVAQHLLPNDPAVSTRRRGFQSLLAFPNGNIFAPDGAKALLSNTNALPTLSGNRQRMDLNRYRFGVSLALLHRLNLQKNLQGGRISCSTVSESHSIFNAVATAWSTERDDTASKPSGSTEALLEEEYREQFPDHQQEFRSLLHKIDMGEDVDMAEMQESLVPEEDWRLNDDQIAILCSLHRGLYLRGDASVDDTMRTRTLCAAYSAAFHLTQIDPTILGDSTSVDIAATVGAHITALGLCSGLSNGFVLDSDGLSDFHRDPNPKEVARAARPLEILISRITQLLNAFPGHAVLLALVRVADHCSKLPLSTTSVGKAMHGLEIILRRAQEWEQHASNLVMLGTPLQDISELVASWRKLELQSWNTLLDSRGSRFAKRARRHWPRLYSVLVSATERKMTTSPCIPNDWDIEAPSWVWKSLKRDTVGSFSDSANVQGANATLADLSRVMDTFLLSSPLGEFRERLSLVETFANQLSVMERQSKSDNASESYGEVGTMLLSLAAFYRQFVPMFESRLSDLRRPIEARLKDEVRLAKWDEQSYYALRESTEKNNRKLMKLLREYDDVLELSVSSILERHLCHGIRAVESSAEEPSSSVPSHKGLFPLDDGMKNNSSLEVSMEPKLFSLFNGGKAWVDPERAGLSCDKYVSRMDHYARRMASFLQSQNSNRLVWSRVGSDNISTMCETIFGRIDALRKESATKAMKQRALVDLFKLLKNHGFRHTKWSVPEEVRDMASLFQLPRVVDTTGILLPDEVEELESAELYFQRMTAEVNRLRSEVQVLGSKYMSQRETQLMLSLSEYGLSMICQQRCVLARVLRQVSSLDRATEGCNSWDGLPVGQKRLHDTLDEFNTAFLSAAENLRQLRLLATTSLPMVEESSQSETIRDIVSLVDESISTLGGYSAVGVPIAVTASDVSNVTSAAAILEEIGQVVVQCRESCRKSHCLPLEVFDSSLAEVRRAVDVSYSILNPKAQYQNDTMTDAPDIMKIASVVVQKVLIGVQALCRYSAGEQEGDGDTGVEDEAIFGCHESAIKELAAIDLDAITTASSAAIEMLLSIHESGDMTTTKRDFCTSVVSGASTLARRFLQVYRQRVADYIMFSRNLAKLNYILVRVFRVLVSKGFCDDSITNENGGDGEGDISGMNFDDDNDGTGMGEGDGKQDVTDQLESEEQLLGLKGEDQDDATTEQQESKELNEEEAKQGMEMEGDFNGDMFDVPDEAQEDEKDGDQDEEELDREMGDGPDRKEDIVDEKMWDESEDEGDQNPADEKFEKDSGMKGESIEDEIRTREDDETQKGRDVTKEESSDPKSSENHGDVDESIEDEQEVNEDSEDNYEEKAAGIDVRDERAADEKDDEGEEPMELDDGLNLDEGSDGETEEVGDVMNVEDQTVEDADGDEDNADPSLVAEDQDVGSDSESSEVNADVLESGISASERNEDGADGEDENGQNEDNHDDSETPEVEFAGNDDATQPTQGIQSKDGKDTIAEPLDEDNEGEGRETNTDNADDTGSQDESQPQASSGGTTGEGGDAGDKGESAPDSELDTQQQSTVSAPNPFKNPGDATKFWHKKLRMLEGGPDDDDDTKANEATNDDQVDRNGMGEFEFAPKDQASSTQVLGEADEEEAARIDDADEEPPGESTEQTKEDTKSSQGKEKSPKERKRSKSTGRTSETEQREQNDGDTSDSASDQVTDEDMDDDESTMRDEMDGVCEEPNGDDIGNRVVTDLSQLNVTGESLMEGECVSSLVQDEGHARITDAELATARSRWSHIQGETHHLSRRLCEKLRLVMEPLVATKLKGDYRTGKRINMKRVIGYIASGYRKDKIWLRRTKPAKRNYRVLLAVDNSESMHKSGAGEMALAAMATLAVGMSQLEIGELGVASFGEDMRLLHPFHQPFTSESGVNVVQNFPFDEKRTRTALCVESAISALETQGDAASMQLVFLISDGRIERDSRDDLRRLVRELVERNVLLVMIIVEGDKNGPTKKKDSIVHMKEVTFKNGKPSVKQFIEDYPFPYYMVLEDMQSLPELLGGALSQWFEMLAQIQGTTR